MECGMGSEVISVDICVLARETYDVGFEPAGKGKFVP